jgi:hypothetical protein
MLATIWTKVDDISFSKRIIDIAYGGGRFVAVGQGNVWGEIGKIAYSNKQE